MTKLRTVLTAFGLLIGAVLGAVVGFGATIPSVPSTAAFSEPSQIISTLNALIQTLNGQASPIAATPQIITLGSYGQATSVQGSGTATLSTQAGRVTYLGMSAIAQAASTLVTLTNTFVTAQSACFAQIVSGAAASSLPFVTMVSPSANLLTFTIANESATSTGTFGATAGMVLAFNCVN